MLASILFTLLGVVLGAIPSWLISRMYYLKSGTDLDAALRPLVGNSQKLRQAVNILARMLEQGGIGKATFAPDGSLNGILLTAPASGGIVMDGSAIPSVTHNATGSGGIAMGGSAIPFVTKPPEQGHPQEQTPSDTRDERNGK